MIYTKTLPRMKDLQRLSGEIKNFPITGLGIAQYADHLGYEEEVGDFIKLFSSRMVFSSRTDFLEHCRLLERLLKQ